jgi:5S rRNA maturation endonuclease (ribonuclease M5)
MPTTDSRFDPRIVRKYVDSKLAVSRWQGDQGTARCPFHADTKPSFSVNAAQGVFCCHGCKAKGNLVEFERRISGCSLNTAKQRIAKLANRGGGSKLRSRIVTLYSYKDENGKVRYQQVRFDPKDFRFRRPDGHGGWIWNLQGVTRILYRLAEVISVKEVFVVEGEKDVETLRELGFIATCNPGGAGVGKWLEEFSQVLKDKKVVILQDNDKAGSEHALAVARSVVRYATEVKLVAPFAEVKDVSQWVEEGGTKERLRKIVDKTPVFESSDAGGREAKQGTVAADDWRSECLRGPLLVSIYETIFSDYLIFPSVGLPLVVSLWAIGTYLFEAFDTYPYLVISSPTKRCGKTRLAELLEKLSARGFLNVNISEAALFRKIARDKPTLILDEAEGLGAKNSERAGYLLSILQAGFRKGGRVTRASGRDHDLEEFDVFCPKVIAAIGNLPDTLRDRGIVIPMRRKLKSEKTERYRFRKIGVLAEGAAESAAVWAEKHRQYIESVYLKLDIEFLQEREADIWEPIFSIASVAVPNRLKELKEIALSLSSDKLQLDVDESLGIRLLSDIRSVFEKSKLTRISTDGLLDRLKDLPESTWPDLNAVRLSRTLRPFKIAPRQLWINDTNCRGYDLDDFQVGFETYLPPLRR